jgi:hypothetical protein
MFDPVGAFSKQFIPVEGGYLYYVSRKEGGKLVTSAEYQTLIENWTAIAGWSGRWQAIALMMLAIALWTLVSNTLGFSDRADQAFIALVVIAFSGTLLWYSMAPRRLVKEREAVAPPRLGSQARREARSALNWPFVAFALIVSGSLFFTGLNSPGQTVAGWAWLAGSGIMFVLYLWITLQKFLDRKS